MSVFTYSKQLKNQKKSEKKIIKSLTKTFWFALIIGSTSIIGYTFNLDNSTWKIAFFLILVSSASFMSGFILGFLFGIPKRNIAKEAPYSLSNSLVEVSDWLTKIIVGLGLVEIRSIPGFLKAIGDYIQNQTGVEGSIQIFSVSSIIYFSVFGFYYGYNYTRLFLSGKIKEADDNLLYENQRKLIRENEILNQQDFTPDNLDKLSLDKIEEYVQLLRSVKTKDKYSSQDWFYTGIAAHTKKEYEKAIICMKNAIAANDNNFNKVADAYIYIGSSYYGLKLIPQAIEAKNEVISSYKNSPKLQLAYYNEGVYFTELEMDDKALQEYQFAIDIMPEDGTSWVSKGYTLIKLKNYDEAIKALDVATTLDSSITDYNSWYNKAAAYALKNDKKQMLFNLEKSIKLNQQCKADAKKDEWFKSYWTDAEFQTLTK